MAARRLAQDAADAAAMAAALELKRGDTSPYNIATAAATNFVQTYNGMSTATVTITRGKSAVHGRGWTAKPDMSDVVVHQQTGRISSQDIPKPHS